MPKLDPDIYGQDPQAGTQKEANRVLGVPNPTLDIWGETDDRAVSEGNHGTQGGGKSSQGEKQGGKF